MNEQFPQNDSNSEIPTPDANEDSLSEIDGNGDTSSHDDASVGYSDTEAENTAELNKLRELSKEIFTNTSETVKLIGDTHLQSYPEVVARENGRLIPLGAMQTALKVYIDQKHFDIHAIDKLREFEEASRRGNASVATLTEYLSNPESTSTMAYTLNQTRGLLDAHATSYVSREGAASDDLPDTLIEGRKQLNDASDTMLLLEDALKSMFVDDVHVTDAYHVLNQRLAHLPVSFDRDALISLSDVISELIGTVKEADTRRNKVSDVAAKLRTIAEKLKDAAA